MQHLINDNMLPSPTVVARTIYTGLLSGVLIADTINSLRRVLTGFVIGSTLAVFLALICAFFRRMQYSIRPLVELVRPIPPIAWIPLSILWFGFGDSSAYFLVSFGAFFPVFSNTLLGIEQINTGTIEVAFCHGATKKMIFFKVILPQVLPSIFSGLKTGIGVSWMIVISAELVGVQSGLGYFIQVSRAQLQTDQVLAGMVIIGCVGLIINFLLKRIGQQLMPWQRRQKKIPNDE